MLVQIFVFGSNLAGRHGKGAALHARQHHGAIYGQGAGLQGSSYAIPRRMPTCAPYRSMKSNDTSLDFKTFGGCATRFTFQVTAVGCGLAGYSPADIGPMFEDAP
jgi:hypothetical protein